MIGALVYILVVVIIVALTLWAIRQFTIPQPLANIITVAVTCIAVLVIVLLLLQAFGLGTGGIAIPKV